jgi:hypothetical protein
LRDKKRRQGSKEPTVHMYKKHKRLLGISLGRLPRTGC